MAMAIPLFFVIFVLGFPLPKPQASLHRLLAISEHLHPRPRCLQIILQAKKTNRELAQRLKLDFLFSHPLYRNPDTEH